MSAWLNGTTPTLCASDRDRPLLMGNGSPGYLVKTRENHTLHTTSALQHRTHGHEQKSHEIPSAW